MEVTQDTAEWSPDDVINLRAFFSTRTGTRLLPKVMENAPALLSGGPTNEIMIRSGEFRGFQTAILSILGLTNVLQDAPVQETAYPSLTDDAQWSGVTGLASEKIEPDSNPE